MEISYRGPDDLGCFVEGILQRITPIDYINETLNITSPLVISGSLKLNGIEIASENNILELPENTSVGGIPLLSPQYINGKYILPSNTFIESFRIIDTYYFNFFSSTTNSPPFQNPGFISNTLLNDSNYLGYYPFLAPRDCVLSSLRFSFVVSVVVGTGTPLSTITSATAGIYIIPLSGTEINTGISATITSPTPFALNSRNFGEIAFRYPIAKGTNVGVKIQYTGAISSQVGISAFAVLGYQYL